MQVSDKLLKKAYFNDVIRSYILLYVAFLLFITIVGIPLMIIWLAGVGQWYSRHYFDKLECELNERTLRFKKGILFQVEKTIPLENIQDLTFIEGPLLRYFHLCILKIETAGQGEHHGNQMKLIGIVDAPAFRNSVLEQRQRITQDNRSGNEIVLLTEIRDTLQKIENHLREK